MKPKVVTLLADLADLILSMGRVDWFYSRYSKTSLTLYWQGFADKSGTSGKVILNQIQPNT